MQRYNKFWIALAAAIVAGLNSYFGSNSEVVNIVTALLGAVGVYATPNK